MKNNKDIYSPTAQDREEESNARIGAYVYLGVLAVIAILLINCGI